MKERKVKMKRAITVWLAGTLAVLGLAGCRSAVDYGKLVEGTHPERVPEEYRYTIRVADPDVLPDLSNFNAAGWNNAETGVISNFRFDKNLQSLYMPETKFRMLYGQEGIYVIFLVHDKYVRAVADNQGATWADSCVELFLQPPNSRFYWNFEVNAGGNVLCTYRSSNELESRWLTDDELASLNITTNLPNKIEEPLDYPVSWTLGFFIPYDLLSEYYGEDISAGSLAGATWRGNLYNCGYTPGNPHWAAWAWVPEIAFHVPTYFGYLQFE